MSCLGVDMLMDHLELDKEITKTKENSVIPHQNQGTFSNSHQKFRYSITTHH
jgi:hypothetical protein